MALEEIVLGGMSNAAEASDELLSQPLFVALASVAVSAFLTHLFSRRTNRNLEKQLDESTKQNGHLKQELDTAKTTVTEMAEVSRTYEAVRERLRQSSVVRDYLQPVLLLGPRNVGKTSLLRQWHAPWDHSRIASTKAARASTVPFHDEELPDSIPHFADESVLTRLHAHLKLRVHDFPGETSAQRSIIELARQETDGLRTTMGQNMGVVLVCMLDSAEAVTGISRESKEYYNGDLFANLRSLVSMHEVDIQRLVIVFNKFDRLVDLMPNASVKELVLLCTTRFSELLEPLHGACNPDKVCETTTVCDQDGFPRSQGASVVLGEAARGLVLAIGGHTRVKDVIGHARATTMMAAQFPSMQ
jgi:hypothetical protein